MDNINNKTENEDILKMQKPIRELNAIISRCLSELTSAIRDFNIEGYEKKTSFSWEKGELKIHMIDEFSLTSEYSVDWFENNRKELDNMFSPQNKAHLSITP